MTVGRKQFMQKSLVRKGLVLGIIVLFVGASVVPSITGTIVEKQISKENNSSFMGFNPRGNILYVGGSGPGNYTTIQGAIDNASDGDTVFVYAYSSPYYENVVIDKSINLIGEDRNTTVIDGGGYGIVVNIPADGATVSGFTIRKGSVGIFIWSNSNTITGNTITSNKADGIYLSHSKLNTITNNIISNNKRGILILESDFNIITGNTISNNHDCILLYYSSSNIISDNSFFNGGLFVSNSYDNNVENNSVNGKPLVYLEDKSDEIITDAGQVILVNCNKITVENQILSNADVGIELWKTDNSIIRNNDFSNNEYGIYFYESSGNNITGNTITSNKADGIYLSHSKSNTITNNIISNNEDGIYLSGHREIFDLGKIFSDGSNNNIILKNNFFGNERDAYFQNSFRNQWKQNYWNRSGILPILIRGEIYWIIPIPRGGEFHWPWFPKIDWNPAKEPYDIPQVAI